jgi:hypothetical protein
MWGATNVPDPLRRFVIFGALAAVWTVAVLVFGIVIGSSLTWQRQQQQTPHVPMSPGGVSDPDQYRQWAERAMAEEQDEEPTAENSESAYNPQY